MPGTTKPASPARTAPEPITFEEALKNLESIVETMETGELPLDKMLAHYEQGVLLSQTCQSRLAEAELKIEALEKNALGEVVLKPVGPKGGQDD